MSRQTNDTEQDYSRCLNYRLPKVDLQQAAVGKRWNAGKTVCEIAKALHLSPATIQATLDGLRRTNKHLVRDEDEPGFCTLAKKKDEDVGPEWNGKLSDLCALLGHSGGDE